MARNTSNTFTTMVEAQAGCRGRELAALKLVANHLELEEVVEWVATGSANTFLGWNEGVVVLTDRRFFVSFCTDRGRTQMWSLPLGPEIGLTQLQSPDANVVFKVAAMPVQGVRLSPDAFAHLRQRIESSWASGAMSEPTRAQRAEDEPGPVRWLSLIEELRAAGVLTDEEHATKEAALRAMLEPTPTPTAPAPPPNWYPNPDGSNTLRYWDGQAWTSHIHAAPGNAS